MTTECEVYIMSTALVLLLFPPLMVLGAVVVTIPLTLLDLWEVWENRRKEVKKLRREFDVWKNIASEHDNVNEAEAKGYAAARAVNAGLKYQEVKHGRLH